MVDNDNNNNDDDGDDDEATGDNSTLFSEIRLTGDVEETASSGTAFDTDFRLSRLRRATTIDGRISSASSMRSNSIASIEKVRERFSN